MTFSPDKYKGSREHNPPFQGECWIVPNSGLRKRMRAARRAPVLPPTEKEMLRHQWYRRKKAMDALRELLA